MEPTQNIELQDMMTIIHGLKMSGLSFVEADALDAINDRIKNLPSSETLESIYSDAREVERLCAEVGRIMEIIDYYGTNNEESKARYKARTKLPPRYKNLKWKKSNSSMRILKYAYDLPDASTEMDAMLQQAKDVEMQLQTTQSDLHSFSTQINQDLPQLQAQIPRQYQPIFQQYAVVVTDATNRLLETSNFLLEGIETIYQSSDGVSQILQQTQTQVESFMSNANYISDIVRLSSNLEGNGIISEKLLTYAKNLRDNNSNAIYDLREVDILLKHANLNMEADILVKTAQFGKNLKVAWNPFKKPEQQYPQGVGVIDPGEQTGSQWQVEDIQDQFTNDINWLKRSWDNLVDFFSRYVRDANILKNEWSGRSDASPEYVEKISELGDQASQMLSKAQSVQLSENFSSKLMGDSFSEMFGNQVAPEQAEPSIEQEQGHEQAERPEEQAEGQDQAQEQPAGPIPANSIDSVASILKRSPEEIRASLKDLSDNGGDITKVNINNIEMYKQILEILQGNFRTSTSNVKSKLRKTSAGSLSSGLDKFMKGNFENLTYDEVVLLVQSMNSASKSADINKDGVPDIQQQLTAPQEAQEAQEAQKQLPGPAQKQLPKPTIEDNLRESIKQNVFKGDPRSVLSSLQSILIELRKGKDVDVSNVDTNFLRQLVNQIKQFKNSNANLINQYTSTKKASFNLKTHLFKVAQVPSDQTEALTELFKASKDPVKILDVDVMKLDEFIVLVENIKRSKESNLQKQPQAQ